ncbi:L,D-transpeptidase [bacterium]|nr:MAG: L,D-transpeptidase [bacterium]
MGICRILIAGLLLILTCNACQMAPVPQEVERAELLSEDLQGAGAPIFAPEEYSKHLSTMVIARYMFGKEQERFSLFRDYDSVAKQYREAIAEGEAILKKVNEAKAAMTSELIVKMEAANDRMQDLRELTNLINEGRLARRSLMRAELNLEDAKKAIYAGDLYRAEREIKEAEAENKIGERTLSPIVCRYLDSGQLGHWKNLVQSAVRESERSGGYLIVVVKLDRKLYLYRDGDLVKTYAIGIGRNGLSDKVGSGDRATPEGKYKICRKLPRSTYYKALLIDYPNAEDQRQFALAKKRGLIPKNRSIGGNVEIHGGGQNSVTYGCVSMDDPDMERIYNLSEVGTPVVIVGALDKNALLTAACGGSR